MKFIIDNLRNQYTNEESQDWQLDLATSGDYIRLRVGSENFYGVRLTRAQALALSDALQGMART